ncbi:hypothetical protein D3C77_355250 [compost metagenome]
MSTKRTLSRSFIATMFPSISIFFVSLRRFHFSSVSKLTLSSCSTELILRLNRFAIKRPFVDSLSIILAMVAVVASLAAGNKSRPSMALIRVDLPEDIVATT